MDWKIFRGNADPHDGLAALPFPPPWRFSGRRKKLQRPAALEPFLDAEAERARPFLPSAPMVHAINVALYLRRPLLITGEPGSGKSTLISKVAHELRLGPVLRWPINSRATVRSGLYEYDAIGRLQATKGKLRPVKEFLKLGPVGKALTAETWPRALLVDEIDKSDLDFANDLLNIIEEGEFDIPELERLPDAEVELTDDLGQTVTIRKGKVQAWQFPLVVMTSNADREFPPAFLRRCIRLKIERPDAEELKQILLSHLGEYAPVRTQDAGAMTVSLETQQVLGSYLKHRSNQLAVATDQLLNAVFLTVALRDQEARLFNDQELEEVREMLLEPIAGTGS